jgi:predicted CXXCH cytochrome family protein
MNSKFAVAGWLIFGVQVALAQSVADTPHNLSASSGNPIRAVSETRICVFCHTPHSESPRKPLWNRPDPGMTYTPYSSSTAAASPGQPTGASILCLSCHDGTIALGSLLSSPSQIEFVNGVTTMPAGSSNLGKDLSDDHPISFAYTSSLAVLNPELADPASLPSELQLDENQHLQCTTCHDPHDNTKGNFLTLTNQYSQICVQCHQKQDWSSSIHASSSATWNGNGNDPWFHTPYGTVTENGCENCHNPHQAGSHARLLNYSDEESNCITCHNGNVASSAVDQDFAKTYRHDVYGYSGIHDPNENALVDTRHVECVDCHNPHTTSSGSATAPDASGPIQGVKGIDTQGNEVPSIQYQYELCYRCHSDNADKPGSSTPRQIEQDNVRLEFDPGNPSYHPIEAPGKNNNVPSLISPYTESSIIYCTDCHASDNGDGSAPHGSVYPHLLKYQYETGDNIKESYQNYRLCYECHSRDQILNGMGRFYKRVHRKHVLGEDTSCNTCHDPHGISATQGNSTNNSHLINFNTSIVQPDPKTGRLEYIDEGNFTGRCYLRCHGENHSPKSY